jgi:hypothetical protein
METIDFTFFDYQLVEKFMNQHDNVDTSKSDFNLESQIIPKASIPTDTMALSNRVDEDINNQNCSNSRELDS